MFENIIKDLKRKKLQAILITNIVNVRYLTNFTGSNAQVLLTRKNLYFFTDFRYLEQATNEVSKEFEIIIYKNFISDLKKILKKEKINTLGFENTIKYSDFNELTKKINFVNFKLCKNFIEKFRKIKSKQELENIKRAIQITEKSLKKCSYYFDLKKINITERLLALKIYNEMILSGAEDISFPIIVLSGHRTSIVHGQPENNRIEGNILIDVGCKYNGYCSDKTISIILNPINNELKKIFTIVKDAKNFAIEKIKPGEKAANIDKIAREYIHSKGYGKYFGHSLGHGVGMEVHELPLISPKSKEIVEPGNVFTVEPGIYIPKNFGVRLEDMVFVTEKGCELLTTPAEEF